MMSKRLSSIFILAVLVASLGLKALALGAAPFDGSYRSEKAVAAARLSAQGFDVQSADVVEERFIRASSGDCVMLVGVLSPRGWHNQAFEALAAPDVRLFYVFDGRVYPRFPRGPALVGYLESRLLSIFAFDRSAPSVLGVAAGVRCRAQRLAWGQQARAEAPGDRSEGSGERHSATGRS
jgi:hypothetical protein